MVRPQRKLAAGLAAGLLAAFVSTGLQADVPSGLASFRGSQTGAPFITVDRSTWVQADWRGVNAAYMPFAAMPEANTYGMTAALRAIEYRRDLASGIHIARAWVGPDWFQPTYPTGAQDFNSTKAQAFYSWLTAMQNDGIDVNLTWAWSYPSGVCLPEFSADCSAAPREANWASLLSDVSNHLLNDLGYSNVKAIQFFTEPNQADTPVMAGR